MRLRSHWGVIGLVALACAACGKKGPPLTPFVPVPIAPGVTATRVVGDDAYVQVTVPAANLDGSKPASVARILVYAATALTPPPRLRFLEIATLIATIPVAPDVEPGEPLLVPPDPARGALQGAIVTVRDTLTSERRIPRALAQTAEARRAPAPVALAAAVAEPQFLRRFYMAVAVSARSQTGPPSEVAAMALTVEPEPPAQLRARQTQTAVVLDWEPSGGLLGGLIDQGAPIEKLELPPQLAVGVRIPEPPPGWPAGPTLYTVYRATAPDPLAVPVAAAPPVRPWELRPPAPVNAKPAPAITFSDPVDLDERERCYVVRAVRGTVEGPPSPRVCVTPIDVYPPATPRDVVAVGAEGQVTLVWTPNSEPDLGGYMVLRREAGSATLLPLTATPIVGARYVDRQVKAGVQYFYAVIAVDTHLPLPNMSPPSVEESDTAR